MVWKHGFDSSSMTPIWVFYLHNFCNWFNKTCLSQTISRLRLATSVISPPHLALQFSMASFLQNSKTLLLLLLLRQWLPAKCMIFPPFTSLFLIWDNQSVPSPFKPPKCRIMYLPHFSKSASSLVAPNAEVSNLSLPLKQFFGLGIFLWSILMMVKLYQWVFFLSFDFIQLKIGIIIEKFCIILRF